MKSMVKYLEHISVVNLTSTSFKYMEKEIDKPINLPLMYIGDRVDPIEIHRIFFKDEHVTRQAISEILAGNIRNLKFSF
jgi:hypothetical protein